MVDLFRYKHWDFVSKRRVYYVIAFLLMVLSIGALIYNSTTRGQMLNLGIDFSGGGLVTYSVEGKLANQNDVLEAIRVGLAASGDEALSKANVQISSTGVNDQIMIHTMIVGGQNDEDSVFSEQIVSIISPTIVAVGQEHGFKVSPTPDSHDLVTGTVRGELITNAIVAVIVGMILIMCWIWFRYNIAGGGLRYSIAGIIALLQDLVLLIGFFAIFYNQFQINAPFIAALLTVLGFSIHDTIIIFDRIRENLRVMKGRTFAETVNISILETLARSVNTVLTLLLPLIALLVFGGSTIKDFVVAMLVGVAAGAFSSIFIASQLLVSWAKPDQKLMPKD